MTSNAAYVALWGVPLERALGRAVTQAISSRSADPIRAVALLLLSAAGEEHGSGQSEPGAAAALLALLQNKLSEASVHAAEASRAQDRPAAIAGLRSTLLTLSSAQGVADEALDVLIVAGAPTSRAGYLRSLPELLPPPASFTAWRDEWPALFSENLMLTGQEVDAKKVRLLIPRAGFRRASLLVRRAVCGGDREGCGHAPSPRVED